MSGVDPTYALVIIAAFAFARPFFEIPEAKAKGEAQKRGGYRPNPKMGCFYVLMMLPLFGCWWWYATATDQILLGIIPTLGLIAAIFAQWVESSSAKGGTR